MNQRELDAAFVRAEAHSIPEPNSGCWIWTGALDGNGYGRMFFQGKNFRASRIVAMKQYGDLGGLHVLHRCDNRTCVNPSHLFLGTHQENVEDMVRKGRVANAKLTPEQVREIRAIPPKTLTLNEIGCRFGVSVSTVWACRKGTKYAHVI